MACGPDEVNVNRRTRAVFGVVAFLLLVGAASQRRTAKTPAGQPPLLELNEANFGQLRHSFNQDTDKVRLVLMLSPT